MGIVTEQIPKEQWREFCDSFSRRHERWRVSVEILSNGAAAELLAREMPLIGITLETREEKNAIVIALGEKGSQHLTHIVSDPVSIHLKQTEDGAEEGVSFETARGVKTLLFFRSPIHPDMLLDGVL
jgi:hypothetical protein